MCAVQSSIMDIQTSLVYVGVVVISAAVVVLVSMFGIKEKSYEEAIAEQRKLPDDLLLGEWFIHLKINFIKK